MKNKLIFIALCLTLICCTLALASCTVVKEVPATQDSDNTTNTPAPTPTHTHTFSSWVPGKNATCAEDGVIGHYTCTGCGKYFDNKKNEFSSVTISKDDFAHVFDSAFDTQCNGCGATYNPSTASISKDTLVIEYAGGRTESVSAKAKDGCSHDLKMTLEVTRHTKFEKGNYVLSCSKCDYKVITEDIIHTPIDPEKAPIVVEEGKNLCEDGYISLHSCAICNMDYTESHGPAADVGADGVHTVSDSTVIVAATCQAKGTAQGTCDRCGKHLTFDIEKGEHHFVYALAVSDPSIDETESYFAAGKCTVKGCNATVNVEIDSDLVQKTIKERPSCNQNAKGTITYSCKSTDYKDENGKKISAEIEIPNLDYHNYNGITFYPKEFYPDVKYDYNEYEAIFGEYYTYFEHPVQEPTCEGSVLFDCHFKCSDCSRIITVNGYVSHVYEEEWEEISTPSCTAAGSEKNTCSVCHGEQTREIPSLNHDYTHTLIAENVEGVYTYYVKSECSLCDDDPTVSISADDIEISIIAPTCKAEGLKTFTYVGADYENVVTDSEPIVRTNIHTLNGKLMNGSSDTVYFAEEHSGIVLSAPSCGGAADATYTCDICAEAITVKAISAHSLKDPTYSAASETISGVCLTCEANLTLEVVDFEIQTALTCMNNGKTLYKTKNGGTTCYALAEYSKLSHTLNGVEMDPESETPYVIDQHPGLTFAPTSVAGCTDAADANFRCDGCHGIITVQAKSAHTLNENHVYVKETGSLSGYCTLCNAQVQFTEASPFKVIVPETCTALGERVFNAKLGEEEVVVYATVKKQLHNPGHNIVPNTDLQYPITPNIIEPFAGEVCDMCLDVAHGTFTCIECDQPVYADVYLPHTDTYERIAYAATCTEEGLLEISCTRCDEIFETREIPATGHNYDFEIDTYPTATLTGHAIGECIKCDKVIDTEMPAITDTDAYDIFVALPGNCTEGGKNGYTFTVNGESFTFYISTEPHGHSLEEKVYTYKMNFKVTFTYNEEVLTETLPISVSVKKCEHCGQYITVAKEFNYQNTIYVYDEDNNEWVEVIE